MKNILFALFACFCGATTVNAQAQEGKSFYDYVVKDIDGKDFPLASLKGKKVLVVNVASKCGLTPQYKDLEELYEKYQDQNFVIIGFPANNFMGQEPGTDAEIKEFCSVQYAVTFPMMGKISVAGDDMAPLYQWLTTQVVDDKEAGKIQWNFQKFMVDETGKLVGVVSPREKPLSPKITDWIENKK